MQIIQDLVKIFEYQSKESIAAHNQAVEGYSPLYNYNVLAREAKVYLDNL